MLHACIMNIAQGLALHINHMNIHASVMVLAVATNIAMNMEIFIFGYHLEGKIGFSSLKWDFSSCVKSD